MALDTVELAIAAQNTFTDPVQVKNYFNISVADPLTGTVTLQRRFMGTDGEWGSWRDIKAYTIAMEEVGFATASESVEHRIGVKTGEYGSGSVTVRLSQ